MIPDPGQPPPASGVRHLAGEIAVVTGDRSDHDPGMLPIAVSDPALTECIFGSPDPIVVGRCVGRMVEEALGRQIASVDLVFASVGVTVGVRLDDGRRVVLKAFQPRWTERFLQAVRRGQQLLVEAGWPAPVPISGPAPLPGGPGRAVIDTWVVGADGPGDPISFADEEARWRSAAVLANLVEVLRPHAEELADLHPHPLRRPDGVLWGQPHNPVFDLSLDEAGAAGIDEVARRARAVEEAALAEAALAGSPPVVSHGDWAGRNLRFAGGTLSALFDLDSLLVAPEPVAVGLAAVCWAANATTGAAVLGDAAGVRSFVAGYEAARGRPFSAAERLAAGAGALGHIAYVARLEHALEAGGSAPDWDGPSARELLGEPDILGLVEGW